MQSPSWLAADTETFLFEPGRMAPQVVCTSYADAVGSGLLHMAEGSSWDAVAMWLEQAKAGKRTIVGHSVSYDFACLCSDHPELLPLVFDAYNADAVTDTLVRQKLINNSRGELRGWRNAATGYWTKHSYSLAAIAKKLLGLDMAKGDDTWRKRFGELWSVPLQDWPEEPKQYAIGDGVVTLGAVVAQEADAAPGILDDQYRQTRADLALNLISTWGIITDAAALAELRRMVEADLATYRAGLLQSGLVRANGSRNMKLAMEIMDQAWPGCPKTPTNRYSITEETCTESGNPELLLLAKYGKAQNLLSGGVSALEEGISKPIHTYFDSFLETGRTSSSGPNIQNPHRAKGVRECFKPRPGYVFAACDFDKAELHTLAQVCLDILGHSRLAERLNDGFDPHLDVGAQLLEITYEEALEFKTDPEVKEARQHAKPANFGFPGGMGAKGFLRYARNNYGIEMEYARAELIRERWLETWPEMNAYFAWIRAQLGHAEITTIRQLRSNRQRGLVSYTEAANSLFQGLAADGAKAAMWAVAERQYARPGSALYGCRTVNFIHDELLVEVPEDLELANAAATELQETMIEAFNPWVPDVPARASVALMHRWSKAAEPTYNAAGLLVPFDGEAAA